MLIKKNPNFTTFLVPIELIDLIVYQNFSINISEKKVPKLFCPKGCNISKIMKVITEGNNVVLLEFVIMINGTKHFIACRKNKKVFAFLSSRK